MKLGKRISSKNNTKDIIQKIILYILVISFVVSFVSTIVISIILACSTYDIGNEKHPDASEKPVLGQFGPIATVILLIGIPFLILVTTVGYAFYISAKGVTDKLLTF